MTNVTSSRYQHYCAAIKDAVDLIRIIQNICYAPSTFVIPFGKVCLLCRFHLGEFIASPCLYVLVCVCVFIYM